MITYISDDYAISSFMCNIICKYIVNYCCCKLRYTSWFIYTTYDTFTLRNTET